MQDPTNQAETSIPAETAIVINGSNLNRTFAVRRKAAKRSESWYQTPVVYPSEEEATPWTKDEFIQLKRAVQIHGGKSWDAISALVPGRTKTKCWNRWNDEVTPSIGTVSGRKGKWTADEDSKLTSAVQRYRGKKWGGFARPG
jgi:hypothetical protein